MVHDRRRVEHAHQVDVDPRTDDLRLGHGVLHDGGSAVGEVVDDQVAAIDDGVHVVIDTAEVADRRIVGEEHIGVQLVHRIASVADIDLVGHLRQEGVQIGVQSPFGRVEDSGIDTGERLETVFVGLIEIILAEDALLRDIQAGLVAGNGRQGQQGSNDEYDGFFHDAFRWLE